MRSESESELFTGDTSKNIHSFVPLFKDLINFTIDTNTFPDKIKLGQIAPIFKKNDPMVKSNYRPVSILPVPSEIYEKVLSEQLSNYFESILMTIYVQFKKDMTARHL